MIYFLLYLFLEVLVSVNISSQIGGIATFFEIVGSAFVGIYILLHFQTILSENIKAVSLNAIDLQQFQERNIFTLIGAILLIIPGFLTDIIGILLQFSIFTSIIVSKFSSKFDTNSNYKNHTEKDENVIDVEIIGDSADK